jgi:hypothetical protein
MNKTIYVFWTEPNELTPRRKNNLQILKDQCGVELKFLDHTTIQDYELPEYKFHEAYQYLSATAKSDYLRSYFMNFYGGAYCDIKRAEWNWNPYFDQLDISQHWIIGYRLRGETDLAVSPDDVDIANIKKSWNDLIGAGAMICKSKTPLTEYWFSLMSSILDAKLDKLKNNPAAHVRDKLGWHGTNSGYPLRWAEIGPETFMRSCYIYRDKISHQLPCPNLDEKYR